MVTQSGFGSEPFMISLLFNMKNSFYIFFYAKLKLRFTVSLFLNIIDNVHMNPIL